MGEAQRDNNRVTTLVAVSNADGTTPVTLYADPTTHRLLVSATTGALGDLSNVTITGAAQGDILYYNGSAWVNLAAGTSGEFLKTQGAGANPTWDTPTAGAAGADTQVQFNDGGSSLGGDAGFTYVKATNTGTIGEMIISGLTASEIVATNGSKQLVSLAVATYPSLTELTYVKGVTSAIQTQLDSKGDMNDLVDDTTPQLGGALDGQGNDLNNLGVIFMTEQAAAEVDVAGKGQVWVKTATPNVIMFTDDAGTDFQLATLAGTETLTNKTIAFGSNTLTGVQAQGDVLDDLNTLGAAASDGQFIVATGAGAFAYESGATVRTSLGLGSAALVATDLSDLNEATIEAAIDTLANLTTIQGLTVTLADAGANAIFGWDDVAGAYENLTQAEVLAVIGDAGLAAKGVVELATAAETTTGTDATRAVTPDGFAGSDYGIRIVTILVEGGATDLVTGDSLNGNFFRVPVELNGYNLVSVGASVFVAGITGNTDIQVNNHTQTADMLSTVMRIETTETDTSTSAQPGTIDTANDDVATGDLITIDVDAVQTGTAPKGLVVTLGFQLP